MSDYPITIQKVDYVHKSGTKDYHLTMINTNSGKSVLIKRYGKVKSFGTLLVNILNPKRSDFEKEMNDRVKRGYIKQADISIMEASNIEQLRSMIGRAVWAKIGPNAIRHLDGALDVSMMRETTDPAYDEDGHRIDQPSASAIAAASKLEELKRAEAAVSVNVMISNPLFGRFG